MAHLVCPKPVLPIMFDPFIFVLSLLNLPEDLMVIGGPSAFNTVIPELSYPLYSRVSNPDIRTSIARFFPVYPIIPHII